MALPDQLVSELVKVTNDRERNRDDNNVVYGTVVDDGIRKYVSIDGSNELTPVISTVTIKAGDRVTVAIRNHTALVTGNVDDPSASSLKLEEIIVQIRSMDENIDGIGILLNGNDEVEGILAKVDSISVAVTDHGVIFKGLTEGTTTIDGSCIKTGTIDTDRINLTGAISWSSLSQDCIDQIKSTASSSGSSASTTLAQLTIKSGGKTYIDGSMIYTESIYAGSLHLGGQMKVFKSSTGSTLGGYIGWCTGWNSTKGIAIMHDASEGQCVCTDDGARLSYGGDSQVVASPYGVTADGSQWVIIEIDGSGRARFQDDAFHGYGVITLGNSTYPWPTIYGKTSSVTVSDRNKKNNIEDLPEKYIALFDNITPRRFKMNDGTSDRYHVGYVAQEVEEAMDKAGIDSQEFGGFVRGYDEDEDGNLTGEETLMLRYEEFNAIYAAKIKQIEAKYEARFKQLEDRIKQLEESLAERC